MQAMKSILLVMLCLGLASCTMRTQTTSGDSYLDKYSHVPVSKAVTKGGTPVNIDEKVRQIAAVEPILEFPARIGLARIDNKRLSNVPGEEMEAWMQVQESQGKNFGEFIPVNPMVADLASSSVGLDHRSQNALINEIRLGAARQHLDAVLVYEVYSKTDSKTNILAVADITIIGGYLLPSEQVEAVGYANAILIDVIQGYPYGTASVVLDKEKALTPSNYEYDKKREYAEKVKRKAAVELTSEVDMMIKNLRIELAEKRKGT